MENDKESFVFYKSFYEALKDLKEKERLKLYDAICELALNGNETKLTGVSKTIFTLIKPQIFANTKRYENGKKGGRPKKETSGFVKGKTIGFENEETKTKPNVNDNVNVNENVNVNVNANDNVDDSCVDGLTEIIDFYNNNIGMITPYCVEVFNTYANEMPKDLIILAMKKAVESGKRTIQYIRGILNNWSKKGIKSVIEAEKEDEQFRNRNTMSKKTEEEEKARKIKELEESQNGNT